MKYKNIIILFVLLFSLSCSSQKTNKEIVVKELLSTSTSWDGEPISYPEGKARIVSKIVEFPEESVLAFHCHPIPTLAYILEGEVLVTTKEGLTKKFSKGEAFVEVMETWHRGKAVNGPLKILVFYAGSDQVPNTIKYYPEIPDQKCVLEPE